jgi:polysaccharide deacetylase 2 family uncharacterized protein YibQ
MFSESDYKTLRKFFKENWSAEEVDEGYTTAVQVGEISEAKALRQVAANKEIALAVALGLVDQEWVKSLKQRIKDIIVHSEGK